MNDQPLRHTIHQAVFDNWFCHYRISCIWNRRLGGDLCRLSPSSLREHSLSIPMSKRFSIFLVDRQRNSCKEGEHVKAGDILVRLDQTQTKRQIQSLLQT